MGKSSLSSIEAVQQYAWFAFAVLNLKQWTNTLCLWQHMWSPIDDLCKGSARLCRLSVNAIISRLYIVPCLHQFRLSKPTRHEIVVKILKYSKPSLICQLCVFKDVRAKNTIFYWVSWWYSWIKNDYFQNLNRTKRFLQQKLYYLVPDYTYTCICCRCRSFGYKASSTCFDY